MSRPAARLLGAAIAALFIGGCAADPDRIEGSGIEARPPNGWLDFCQRNPQDRGCAVERRT